MSNRDSNDSTSQSGKNYQAGAASSSNPKNILLTKNADQMSNSLLGKSGGFNGHAVEIWADGAVYDTVSGSYLFPGKDYNPGDLQRK